MCQGSFNQCQHITLCRGTFALFSLLKRQGELASKSKSVDTSLTQYSYNRRPGVGQVANVSFNTVCLVLTNLPGSPPAEAKGCSMLTVWPSVQH